MFIFDNHLNSPFLLKMSNNKTLFICQFSDGYSFRNEIEYLKSTNTEGNLIFTKNAITYTKSNGPNTLLNRLRIRTEDINYFFNDKLVETVIFGFSLTDFARITKAIGKRDGFKLYMTRDENDEARASCVLLSHNAQVSSQQNVSYLKPKEVPVEEYEIPKSLSNRTEPNCSPPISEFCRSCSALNTAKCLHVKLICYKNALELEGLDASGKAIKKYRFGSAQMNIDPLAVNDSDIPEHNEKPIVVHIVHVSTIKAISRMTNISPQSSLIKFYFEPDCPILISIKVGTYAEHETYLRSEVDDSNF